MVFFHKKATQVQTIHEMQFYINLQIDVAPKSYNIAQLFWLFFSITYSYRKHIRYQINWN